LGEPDSCRNRAIRCQRVRGEKGAIIAVYFYERTSAVEFAELNTRG
jgi:hypothetical protein